MARAGRGLQPRGQLLPPSPQRLRLALQQLIALHGQGAEDALACEPRSAITQQRMQRRPGPAHHAFNLQAPAGIQLLGALAKPQLAAPLMRPSSCSTPLQAPEGTRRSGRCKRPANTTALGAR